MHQISLRGRDMDSNQTAVQKGWIQLAAAIRMQLANACEEMGAMNPEDLKNFVETAQSAYWLEVNAFIFDNKVDKELRNLFPD